LLPQNVYHAALLISGNPSEMTAAKVDLLNITNGYPVLDRDGMATAGKWVPGFRNVLAQFEVHEDDDRFLSVYFDCAVPPIEALFFFSKKYPNLTFRMDYADPKRDLTGSTTIVGGKSALELVDMPESAGKSKANFVDLDNLEMTSEDFERLFDLYGISTDPSDLPGRKKKILLN